jgi:hypothetical protein
MRDEAARLAGDVWECKGVFGWRAYETGSIPLVRTADSGLASPHQSAKRPLLEKDPAEKSASISRRDG